MLTGEKQPIFRESALKARLRPKELDEPLWADAPHERHCRFLLVAALVVALAWVALWPVERSAVRDGVLVVAGDGGNAHVVLFVDADLAATARPGARVRVRGETADWADARTARIVGAARLAADSRGWLPRRTDESAPADATHRLRAALDAPWSDASNGMRVEGAVALGRQPLLRLRTSGGAAAEDEDTAEAEEAGDR